MNRWMEELTNEMVTVGVCRRVFEQVVIYKMI